MDGVRGDKPFYPRVRGDPTPSPVLYLLAQEPCQASESDRPHLLLLDLGAENRIRDQPLVSPLGVPADRSELRCVRERRRRWRMQLAEMFPCNMTPMESESDEDEGGVNTAWNRVGKWMPRHYRCGGHGDLRWGSPVMVGHGDVKVTATAVECIPPVHTTIETG